jgi:hypothetical protein
MAIAINPDQITEIRFEYAKHAMFRHISEKGDNPKEAVKVFFTALDDFENRFWPEFREQNRARHERHSAR